MTAMTDEQDWQRVGRAIADRIGELRLTKAEVLRSSGLTTKTLDRYIDGKPVKRVDKKRELTRTLEWSPDSIDRLLRGEPPVDNIRNVEYDPATSTLRITWHDRATDVDVNDVAALRRAKAAMSEQQALTLDEMIADLDAGSSTSGLNDDRLRAVEAAVAELRRDSAEMLAILRALDPGSGEGTQRDPAAPQTTRPR